MMTLLLIAGCSLFAVSLVLPAYEGGGFLKIGGPGWRMLWLSAVLGSVGFVAMVREGNPRAPLCLLPLALNMLMLVLAALGLGALRGDGVKVLGGITLLSLGVVMAFLLLRCRGELRPGTFSWALAGLLLSVHALVA